MEKEVEEDEEKSSSRGCVGVDKRKQRDDRGSQTGR